MIMNLIGLGCFFLEGMAHRLVTLGSHVQDRSLLLATADSHIVRHLL